MVVLHQHAVIHAHAVVRAAAAGDGVLLEDAQAGRRLARVEDERAPLLRRVDELPRERRRRAHPLHEVERRALRREDAARLAAELQDRLVWLHLRSVGPEDRHLDRLVDGLQDGRRDRCARDDARHARVDLADGLRLRVDKRLARRVAAPGERRIGDGAKVLVQCKQNGRARARRLHHVGHLVASWQLVRRSG